MPLSIISRHLDAEKNIIPAEEVTCYFSLKYYPNFPQNDIVIIHNQLNTFILLPFF